MMKARAPKGKNVIRIEVSPAKEHTENFTMRDWEQLWDDFVREYDSMEFKDKHGEVYSHKTNFAGSIYSVCLHLESDSGIPHLHAAVCRKDNEGRTNNDHNIHLRAQYAAERVARQRGWTTAMDIHRMNADEVAVALTDILRSMPSWSWIDYVARVRVKGYTLEERRDKQGVLRGYTVGKDYRFYIPDKVMQLFDDEFDYRETANHKELTNYAVALFVGMMDVPTVPLGGGGGTSNDLPWGQKGDEDEMERARRCAHAAVRKLGKKPKLSIRR